VDLSIYSPIRLHGVVLNYLSTGTTLFFPDGRPSWLLFFGDRFPHFLGLNPYFSNGFYFSLYFGFHSLSHGVHFGQQACQYLFHLRSVEITLHNAIFNPLGA
jgi:hypothetical protein